MNSYAIFILASLIVVFGVELIADLLNVRALQFRLPTALEGLYKPDEYRKSQDYLRVSTYFGMIARTFLLAVTLAFWFSRGFGALDNLVRSWGFPTLINGLLYLGILFFAYGIITLPFDVYDTFVIEQRFGFNRTTVQTYIVDKLKMLVLLDRKSVV